EADTQTSLAHCGGCGTACSVTARTVTQCDAGSCNATDCAPDRVNLNLDPRDACEIRYVIDDQLGWNGLQNESVQGEVLLGGVPWIAAYRRLEGNVVRNEFATPITLPPTQAASAFNIPTDDVESGTGAFSAGYPLFAASRDGIQFAFIRFSIPTPQSLAPTVSS